MQPIAKLKTLMPPQRRYRAAEAYEDAGRWAEAERVYRSILGSNDRDANAFARLGRVLEQQRKWPQATEAYRAALAIDSRRKWFVRLGKTLEKSDREEARRVYASMLDHDPKATTLDRALLKADSRRFTTRRRYVRFVRRNLDEIRERAFAERFEPTGPPRIWMYWAQGIENAPPLVRYCHQRLRRFHAADEVTVLNEATVSDYADIPESVREQLAKNPTKFSDVLRLELLMRHGGLWLDATCFVRANILEQVTELMPGGFFAFRYRRARISSWLLASEPNHPVVAITRAAQYLYWERFRRPIDYYVLHHLFESLYYVDGEFRGQVLATPWQSSHPPARFARRMLEPYDRDAYKRLLEGSFVHKLSYKYREEDAGPDTMLGHLLAGEEP